MTEPTAPKRRRGSFVVSPRAQTEFGIIEQTRYSGEAARIAREALDAALAKRLTREEKRRG